MSSEEHEQVSIYPFSEKAREDLLSKARELIDSDLVKGSVPDGFFAEFEGNLKRRGFLVGALMGDASGVAAV
jgi:hypothetical protein